jgi:protein TonB
MALAVAVNAGLLFVLWGIGKFAPEVRKASHGLVVDLLPPSTSNSTSSKSKVAPRRVEPRASRPLLKPPPVQLPARPTILSPPTQPTPEKPAPFLELSKDEMAAADVRNLPKAREGSGSNDSEVVGHGPHGELLYAAEWARHPTDAELGGYLPPGAPEGFGLIACKTIPGDRVEDCIELDQEPHGSHLANAVRQAAWQFRIRPPRKNGVAMIGEWVEIRIDYEHIGRREGL